MINENTRIPLTAAVGGAAALAVRAWNLRTGFEAGTGLPVSGPSFSALLAVLAIVGLSLLLQSRHLTERGAVRFPFRAGQSALCVPAIAGAFLLAPSGAADIFESVTGENALSILRGGQTYEYAYAGLISGEAVGMSAGVQRFCGLLTLCAAWAAFVCVRACLRGNLPFRAIVLIPAVALSFRLVTVYRIDSVNPVLQDYAPALVALMLQVWGFYCVSAFAFDCGTLTAFAVSSGAAACAALCVVLDESDYISTPLTLGGSAATLVGFLLLALRSPSAPDESDAQS